MRILSHKFVEFIPDLLEDNVLYVSLEYSTAVHNCCCGCGARVVTPLSPTDWRLTFDGESISLYPSIGNWNFECQSHYWIKNSRVQWAPKWSQEEINAGRRRDFLEKRKFYGTRKFTSKVGSDVITHKRIEETIKLKSSFWSKLKHLWYKLIS